MGLGLEQIFLFVCFWSLSLAGWARRRKEEWALDGVSLFAQGLLVPLIQSGILVAGAAWVWPGLRGDWDLPPAIAFLLSFTLIDYLYYWNHRLLHRPALWSFHQLHHSSPRLDVFATSRNSLWTPLLIVYVWVQGAFLFLLADPVPFLWGIALSNALDLWRHSGLRTPEPLRRVLGPVLILPEDHEWHHSRDREGVNFGANLNLWDRWHGSFWRQESAQGLIRPSELGQPVRNEELWSLFWKPWTRTLR